MKIFCVSLAAAVALAAPARAQQRPELLENKVYTYAEQMPELPGGGGTQAIIVAIQKLVRYPIAAQRAGVEGKVYLSFVVLPDGLVSDPRVIKGLGSGLDEAALVAVQQLPRFVPGKQNGQPVAVSYTVPITFRLGEKAAKGIRNESAASPAGTPPAPRTPPPAGPVDTTKVVYQAMPMPALPPAMRATLAAAQQKRWTADEARYYTRDPEQFATVQAFVQQDLVLPAEVLSGKTEGQVRVGFVVSASGVIRNVRVMQPLSAATDTAALQAVRRLPRLVPGRVQDQPVAVLQIVYLDFLGPNHVYDHAPQMPVFPAPGLLAYLHQHLRVPPIVAAENLDGQVSASFVVRADGSVADPKITTGMCTSCDAEVLRFLQALPRYQPAQLNGRPVAVRQQLYVRMPADPVDKDSLKMVYTYVEQMPTMPAPVKTVAERVPGRVVTIKGNEEPAPSLAQAVQQRVVLPAEVQSGAVEGKVFVSFAVGPRGGVYNAKIVKPLSAACDAAALAAIKKLPRLVGGKQNGRGVAVSFTMPVVFAKPGVAAPAGK